MRLYLFIFPNCLTTYWRGRQTSEGFVRNCFFHQAGNKSCKSQTRTSSQTFQISVANRSQISTIHVSKGIYLELLLVQSIAIRNLISPRFTALTKGQPFKDLLANFIFRPDTYVHCRAVYFLIVFMGSIPVSFVGDYYCGIIVIYWVRAQLRQSVIEWISQIFPVRVGGDFFFFLSSLVIRYYRRLYLHLAHHYDSRKDHN